MIFPDFLLLLFILSIFNHKLLSLSKKFLKIYPNILHNNFPFVNCIIIHQRKRRYKCLEINHVYPQLSSNNPGILKTLILGCNDHCRRLFCRRLFNVLPSVFNFLFISNHNFPNCASHQIFSNILVATRHGNCCKFALQTILWQKY